MGPPMPPSGSAPDVYIYTVPVLIIQVFRVHIFILYNGYLKIVSYRVPVATITSSQLLHMMYAYPDWAETVIGSSLVRD